MIEKKDSLATLDEQYQQQRLMSAKFLQGEVSLEEYKRYIDEEAPKISFRDLAVAFPNFARNRSRKPKTNQDLENQEQNLRLMTAQYLEGQVSSEQYRQYIDENGPTIDFVALANLRTHKQETETFYSFINKAKSFAHTIISSLTWIKRE